MKQLHDRSHFIPAVGRHRVDRTRLTSSSRSLGIKVSATAEATSAVDTSVESQVESQAAPGVRVDGPVTKRVHFEIFREVSVGDEIRVVGDHEELGAWDASQGLPLVWHPGHVWKGSMNVPPDTQFLYKLVKAGPDGVCEWEEGDDRSLDLTKLPSDGISASAVWGQPAQYASCVPYAKNEPEIDEDTIEPAADLSSQSQGSYTARIAIQKELCLGQHLKLVGSSPALGEWDFRAAPAFTWSPEHVWQLEVSLPLSEPVDWKIVQAVEGNDHWCEWQSGENTIVDPSALQISSGDVLEVGCSWDGPSRATIVETAGTALGANGAAQAQLIKVTEEPVYGSDGVADSDSDTSTAAIASVAHAVSTSPAPQAAVDTQVVQDAAKQGQGDEDAQKPQGLDMSIGWGAQPTEADPISSAPAVSQEPSTDYSAAPAVSPAEAAAPADNATAPVGKADGTSSQAEALPVPAAEKPLTVSPWDTLLTQDAAATAAVPQTAIPAAEADVAVPAVDSKSAAKAPIEPSPGTAQDSTEVAAPSAAQGAEDVLKELQSSGTGLEDMVLSPEQLSKLAEAGITDSSKVTIADPDDVTFELQKGRLGKDDEGSTIVVRGGMDYDSETGTVTVNSPLGAGPDGILVDADGNKTEEEVKAASGSTQEPAVKLISPDKIADVEPQDEVGALTKVGAYAGMAAAGLGAATLMGGLAVDFADVALVAGLYGVATAISTSRSDAIRAKGAAGPVLSALVTASDIAKRMKGPSSATADPEPAVQKKDVKPKPTIGKYEKSDTADVSKRGSVPIPTNEQIAAWQAEQAIVQKAGVRALEMQVQLGDNGMHALEDGVNQVMATDVQRILKALDSNLSDEDKVIHLVRMLLNGQPAVCKTEECLKVEVRAAMSLAQEHVSTVQQKDKQAQHAPPVLLAALAMSAVDEMRGVKSV